MPIGAAPRGPVSTISLDFLPVLSNCKTSPLGELAGGTAWTTATLRCGEENSSANIFITDMPFRFADFIHLHPTKAIRQSIFRPPFDSSLQILNGSEPAFGPFNGGNAGGLKIIFQSCGQNLFASFQPV